MVVAHTFDHQFLSEAILSAEYSYKSKAVPFWKKALGRIFFSFWLLFSIGLVTCFVVGLSHLYPLTVDNVGTMITCAGFAIVLQLLRKGCRRMTLRCDMVGLVALMDRK